ncbi:transglycosylase family protein [Streptomyces natalensis]|uniref:Transglycosylase n=1 Tax=Streptomyces natalensis ATCC 27448 TaxID=1240678 RepID=A0A0D7CT50_9ACTN|nr:transglycosylase family protein [Streptomyces natalensis]KIZ19408.1 transglycosylase [Streptomyces natalensis ATCC 27448]
MSSRFVKRSVEAILPVLIVLLSAPGLATRAIAAAAPPTAPADTDWEAIAACESSGRWHINTGNGYHGGLQIAPTTWRAYGGERYAPRADLASRWQQIAVGERIVEDRGLAPWPNCGHYGLSGSDESDNGATVTHRHPSAPHHSRPSHRRSGRHYVVQEGDCLSSIAHHRRIPGGARALYEMNRRTLGTGPDHIYPGQRLHLHR